MLKFYNFKKILSVALACVMIVVISAGGVGTVAHANTSAEYQIDDAVLESKIEMLKESGKNVSVISLKSSGEEFLVIRSVDNNQITSNSLEPTPYSVEYYDFYHLLASPIGHQNVHIAEAETKIYYTREYFNDTSSYGYNFKITKVGGNINLINSQYNVGEFFININANGPKMSLNGAEYWNNESNTFSNYSFSGGGAFSCNTGFAYYHSNLLANFGGIYVDYNIIFMKVSTGDAAYSLSFRHTLPVNGGF